MIESLTLDQLRVLEAVAEAGSFSAAGRRLGRVQSAVSQAVASLEQALGLTLFDRTGRIPTLTPAGVAVLDRARLVLHQTRTLQAQAAAMAAGREAALVVAADSLFPAQPLLDGLKALRETYPDLPVTLYTEPLTAAARRIRSGEAHLALCALRPEHSPDLTLQPLLQVEMLPVVAPTHPLAASPTPIAREALEAHTQLILTDPVADPDAPNFGVVSTRVWRYADLGRRIDFLKAGFGFGSLPRHLAEPLIASGELVALKLAEPWLLLVAIPMFAGNRRDRPLGPAARWFVSHLLAQRAETGTASA